MVMVYMATAVDFYKANPEGEWDSDYGLENYESRKIGHCLGLSLAKNTNIHKEAQRIFC